MYPGTVSTESRNITVNIGLPPPESISLWGKITDPQGRSLANVSVSSESYLTLDNKPFVVHAQTGSDGTYLIHGALGYRQKISVDKAGYESLVKEIVFENETNELNFELGPRSLFAPGFDIPLGLIALFSGSYIVYRGEEPGERRSYPAGGAIPVVLVLVGIIAGIYLTGMHILPSTDKAGEIVPVPTANTTLSSASHCIVMEYDAMRAADTRIVPVTDEELRDFPEVWKWMNGTPVTGPGIMVHEPQATSPIATTGSRRSGICHAGIYRRAECTSPSQKSPTVFAYQGRYYFVTCYSGFGLSGHPGYPGPANDSAAECP